MTTIRWTEWMRWTDIVTMTRHVGFLPNESTGFPLNKNLDALVAQGLAEKRKDGGTAQSAPAYYRFLITPQADEPAVIVTVPSLDDAERFLNG